MSKLLAGLIAALIVGVGVAAAGSLNAEDDPTRTGTTVSTLDDSVGTTGTTTGTTTTTETGTTPTGTTETGEDVSGPCDEAEHANDPRCVGGTATAEDDEDDDRRRNRGHGGDDDDGDDHGGRGRGGDHGDRSGSNSGRG